MEDNKTKKFLNKKIIIIMCILIIAVICIVIFFRFYNSGINKFKRGLDDYNIDELKDIYISITSYDERKEIESIFEERLSTIVTQFTSNKKSYEDTYAELEKYNELSNLENKITKAKEQLVEIKTSKDNYSKGQNAEKNNNLFEAIENYSKVIELDNENYKMAQKYINDNKNTLKNNMLIEIDELINNGDYINANLKLELLQTIFTNDTTIESKVALIKDKAKQQEIEKYKNEQEMTVISATKHKEWYSDTISGVKVIVQNNTQKVVKSYVVSVLAYDADGYPLKIEYNNYECLVEYEGANVQPGATHGKDNYGSISYEEEKISSALACVKEVEYYDGTTWENPYYEYWLEQYKEKPIEF